MRSCKIVFRIVFWSFFLSLILLSPNSYAGEAIKLKKKVIKVDGLSREYELYVPPYGKLDAIHGMPLLLVLHGGGPAPRSVTKVGFSELGRRDKVIIAYPRAYKPKLAFFHMGWNDGRGTTPSAQEHIDDMKFLNNLITALLGAYPIDSKRVFLTGASNGGLMTYRMGCEASTQLAGIAPVIANIPEAILATCSPKNPLAFVAINGTDDPLMPYQGGEVCHGLDMTRCYNGYVTSAETSLSVFARAEGVDTSSLAMTEQPIIINDGTSVIKHSFSSPSSNKIVAYEIQGMGHAWPPFPPQLEVSGKTSKNINATAIIWRFFKLDRKNG